MKWREVPLTAQAQYNNELTKTLTAELSLVGICVGGSS